MPPAINYSPDEVADLEALWDGDVVVVGGGSAGAAAAVASARTGARVLLVESGGFLGGTGVRVLDTFYGFYPPGGKAARVVGGIGWEVCEQLFAAGQAFERPNTYGAGTGVTYEPEFLKFVWDALIAQAGCDLLLHTIVTASVLEDDRLVGLVAHTKAGPGRIDANVIIDATGDAEVAWRAGAALDRSANARSRQPATATFRVGGVSDDPASTSELHSRMRQAVDTGGYDLPRVEGSSHVTNLPGVRHTNLTRVMGYDVTDPWELTNAELEGRRQVQEYLRFLRNEVSGYKSAHLLHTSTRLGIRESRRLDGRYVLDREDVLAGRDFDDAIARCGAPVEDHADGEQTKWEYVGGGDQPSGATYGIPYRALLPRGVTQLIVAGRCLSATHDAHASVRSMGQCMAMGHAAGVAAVQAVETSTSPDEIDVGRLRSTLTEQGAIL